jgi:hypothetical protein
MENSSRLIPDLNGIHHPECGKLTWICASVGIDPEELTIADGGWWIVDFRFEESESRPSVAPTFNHQRSSFNNRQSIGAPAPAH